MRTTDNESNDLDFLERLSKESTKKSYIDPDLSGALQSLDEIIPKNALKSLEEMFFGWLSS
jgi:hypothetical protein